MYNNQMSPKEIFTQLSLWIVNFYVKVVSELWIFILNLISFAFISFYIYMCGSESVFLIRIRIHKAPEYGSNMDPDPQHCF